MDDPSAAEDPRSLVTEQFRFVRTFYFLALLLTIGYSNPTQKNDDLPTTYLFTTYAGSGGGHQNGDRSEALFHKFVGIEVTPDGIIYIADTLNNRIVLDPPVIE